MDNSLIETQLQVANGFSSISQALRPMPGGGGGGGHKYNFPVLDMVSFRSMNYTSLKDLIPASPPSDLTSPTRARMVSLRDIPIKDPLVQHAAWAYLQPAAETLDGEGGLFYLRRLKETLRGLFGCFSDVLLAVVRRRFCEATSEEDDDGGADKI